MLGRRVDQLMIDYPDIAWRQKYAEYCDLIEILSDCIIADSYVASDALNMSMALTQSGVRLRDKLVRKEHVNAKDATIMCALTIGHSELLVDIDAIDIDHLASAIGAELSEKRIRFPFIYGRALYDAFASAHEDERDSLSVDESISLMDKLEPGVFQYGSFTVGPFGLQRSPVARSIQAKRYVPAYHCSQAICPEVHLLRLETSTRASINADRARLDLVLSGGGEPAEWWSFAREIHGLTSAYYRDRESGVLLPLLGDCLTEAELRMLVAEMLDNSKGALRSRIAPFFPVGSALEAVEHASIAQLLQISLFIDEKAISNSIDALVRRQVINIPEGDIRRPIINSRFRSGAFRVRAEIGSKGIREVSDEPGFALLRERRLLDKLYMRDAGSDVAELEWQLRGVDVADLDERLEHFFQSVTPREAMERLVLARRTNMRLACDEVGLTSAEALDDRQLVDAILWKLGFDVTEGGDPHADFWQRHERMWALTQSSGLGRSDRFMEVAAPYFAQLEGLLIDGLAFTSWALLNDHVNSSGSFSYDNAEDRDGGLRLLQAGYLAGGGDEGKSDYASQRLDLSQLIHGFNVLAVHLTRIEADAESYKRTEREVPEYDGKTDLKEFALRSTVPYLDMSRPSRERIVGGLRDIAKLMLDADVSSVRNDYAHYRANLPDVARIETALEAIRRAVTKIETLGFCRLLFTPSRISIDPWGQGRFEFVAPRSFDHVFIRPTRFDWMGLPPMSEPQFLVRSASFGDPREVLRFTRRYRSKYSDTWAEFPNRRSRGRAGMVVDAAPAHDGALGRQGSASV